ncbi:MAG: ribonucleotide-diphosphate reductase subunit beta [Candidatus Gracilibacteria bacterium]|nr:ribonucleotide-diphosphate reductase subunit beta [Candidatus Gracilibacteria bacterium]
MSDNSTQTSSSSTQTSSVPSVGQNTDAQANAAQVKDIKRPQTVEIENTFYGDFKMTQERPNVNDRRVINGEEGDVVQLSPIKHQFAWDAYKAGNANHWLPEEISMQKDIELWKSDELSDNERRAIEMTMGFFTTADSIVANNLVLAIYKHITSPECRMYLLRQSFEEAVHTHSYQYIVESIGLDESKIFNMYREIDSIYNKDMFAVSLTEGILDSAFTTKSDEAAQMFLENLIIFYVVMEGIFFYSSFVMMLSFQRQNKMVGTAEQFQYIMRDESMHMNFGIDMINTVIDENPQLWTPEFQEKVYKMVRNGVELEVTYGNDVIPYGILGLSPESIREYVQHIADRRLERIRLKPIYGSENPFPWMSEAIDLGKEKNFFERRVTEYQVGGTLEW